MQLNNSKTINEPLSRSKILLYTYMGSVVAANIAEITTYPLDLAKTRLQIQGEMASVKGIKVENAPYRGLMKTAFGIIKEEGLHKLWQGIVPALYRHVLYSGIRIVTYQYMRETVFKYDGQKSFPIWKSALSGMLAGALSQFIASPTDLVKVQIQMEGKRKLMKQPPRVHGTYDAFAKILKQSGFVGLWKGSITNVQRAALVNLGDLTTYDTTKRLLLNNTSLKDNHFTHFLASACAGCIAAVMGTPADVVKTRIMNQPTDSKGRGILYKSSISCLQKTIVNEGFFALYKGFLPCWIRMGPWSLIFWLSFEEIQKFTGSQQF